MNKKGIILAGGFGTRLFPLTRVISKQLLPVYDKPMIYYPLTTLMQIGIKEVMIIATFEDVLRYEKILGDGGDLGINISYKVQQTPRGIPDSFLLCKEFIGKDPVTLILGDNIFYGKDLELLLKNTNAHTEGASVFAIEVDEPEKYGVVEKSSSGKIIKILEKPKNPPSKLAVTGLYFYDNDVVEIANHIKESARGELEITDVNNVYLEQGKLHLIHFNETVTWFDTGGFDTLLDAAIFVKNEQKRFHTPVGSPEWTAYKNGWISKEALYELGQKSKKSNYGKMLLSL